MSAGNFAAWLRLELTFEGGKVDDPQDPGGRTAYGVTQRVYDGWRRNRHLMPRDVFLITQDEISSIYAEGFWKKVCGDQLPDGVDIVVADGAINSGPSQSIKWVQRALGVRVDGVMGDATIAAIRAHPDHDALVAAICDRRLAFLKALKTFRRFGRGWTSRVQQLEIVGQRLASGADASDVVPLFDRGMSEKARLECAKTAPPRADAIWGAGAAGGTISQVVDALTPTAEHLQSVSTLLTVLTALGGALTVGGLIYRTWAAQRAAQLADALDLRPASPLAPSDPGAAMTEPSEQPAGAAS